MYMQLLFRFRFMASSDRNFKLYNIASKHFFHGVAVSVRLGLIFHWITHFISIFFVDRLFIVELRDSKKPYSSDQKQWVFSWLLFARYIISKSGNTLLIWCRFEFALSCFLELIYCSGHAFPCIHSVGLFNWILTFYFKFVCDRLFYRWPQRFQEALFWIRNSKYLQFYTFRDDLIAFKFAYHRTLKKRNFQWQLSCYDNFFVLKCILSYINVNLSSCFSCW